VQNLAMAAVVAPYTASDIMPLLQGSAVGAAKSCTGSSNGTECGVTWYTEWDGTDSMSNQLSATGLFTANLVSFGKAAPATQSESRNTTSSTSTGSGTGTSSSNAEATTTGTTTGTSAASGLVVGPVALVAAIVAGTVALF
jgi:mannan endo-1,6-alpha-mannosidase